MTTLAIRRALIAAFTVAAAAALPGVASAAPADSTSVAPVAVQPAPAELSRAEVQADTAMWLAAGMARYEREGGDEETYTPAYQNDLAVYNALRRSPQFTALVHAYQNGQSVRVSVTRDPLRVSIATR